MRLCFANASRQQITDGVRKLAAICHQEFGVPQHSGNVTRSV
jgi:DNA-binding transcriptional MocR family regulator